MNALMKIKTIIMHDNIHYYANIKKQYFKLN